MNAVVRASIRVAIAAMLFAVLVVTAELTARVDDWWFHGVPPFVTPSYNDLFMTDASGQRRGKPLAQFQKWRMNSFGFRAPEMTPKPVAPTRRVMVLGASEAFGLYETPDKEFAAQLGVLARPHGIEVINAALPGITISTLDNYWRQWAAQFAPETVIIYPSTHLYLTCEGWTEGAASNVPSPAGHHFGLADLRLLERMKSVIAQPDFVVRWKNEQKVASEVERHPASWVYTEPPAACIARLRGDLAKLADDIRATGANVVLCTHAIRASFEPTPDDFKDLDSFRVFSPRAPAAVMARFATAANEQIRALAAERGFALVDIERALRGKRTDFEDLVHFNDHGAQEVAELLMKELVPAKGAGQAQRP